MIQRFFIKILSLEKQKPLSVNIKVLQANSFDITINKNISHRTFYLLIITKKKEQVTTCSHCCYIV